MPELKGIHILIVGNPVDGLTFYGPFATADEANAAGERVQDDWWIAPLKAPDAELIAELRKKGII
jgi:hypothetical protein